MDTTELITWAWLPDLILNLIFEKLTCVSDCLRFSAVCKPWYSFATLQQRHMNSGSLQQLPLLLMLPTKKRSTTSRLYSVTTCKILDMELHVPSGRRKYYGFSHGWLAFTMFDFTIGLFNPFSGQTIQLPPLKPSSDHCSTLMLPCLDTVIKKVILSKNPSTNPDDFEVVALISGIKKELAILKNGAKYWNHVVVGSRMDEYSTAFCDVIYHNNVIYAVNYQGMVISVDTTTLKFRQITRGINSPQLPRCYLVKSTVSNELLLVQLFFHNSENQSRYIIGKFDDRKSAFILVRSLGEEALFLGDNHSMCILSSKVTGCKADHIYYMDHGRLFLPKRSPEMGTFDIRRREYRTWFSLSSSAHAKLMIQSPMRSTYKFGQALKRDDNLMPQAIWITPTPKFM